MRLLNGMRPLIFSSLLHSIDCAGILKLRNSDIELRKGETDIGRKNTRVRVVFRVHIPQPNGKVLSLQAASIPVECCECLTHAHTHMHSHTLADPFWNFFYVNLWMHWVCRCLAEVVKLVFTKSDLSDIYSICIYFYHLHLVSNTDCNKLQSNTLICYCSKSPAFSSGAAPGRQIQPEQLFSEWGRRNGHQWFQLLPRVQGHLPGERPR